MGRIPRTIDHLVYATPDLAASVDQMESILGVRAAEGGAHPHWGTRNALISLGPELYLEIIGPDPENHRPADPPFGLRGLERPRLATWSARVASLERITHDARRAGIDLGGVRARSRLRPDGTTLAWKMTDPSMPREAGILPFFIDWGDALHPALGAPQGCELVELRAEHPDPARIRAALAALGMELAVSPGATPALVATLATPRGPVELR
jgi:catechol 2,3-dioxygenase-like lactoylglutathione lyase family enzyme